MVAPEINNMITSLKGGNFAFGDKDAKIIDNIFLLIHKIAPCGDDERREIWLKADRGSIDDFGEFEDYLDAEVVDDYEEFEEWWESLYPDEICWFKMTTVEHDHYRAIFLDRQLIYQSEIYEKDQMDYQLSFAEFFTWMVEAVQKVISDLQADSYNEDVKQNLSLQERTGVIRRKDFWNIFPEDREDYFSDITKEEVEEFTELIADQKEDSPVGAYISDMTSGKFYEFCRSGYAANDYEKANELSAKELYYKYADGRDEDLSKLDENSPEEFENWFHDRSRWGGHPWEVCAGGNSTHISLFVGHNENGYYLGLAGKSFSRSIETVKFYLALRKAGVSVFLYDAKCITDRLLEQDYIGIVPEKVIPAYCEGLFPGYEISDFMHLPDEELDEVTAKIVWLPETKVELY